jgi:hypothetical protein
MRRLVLVVLMCAVLAGMAVAQDDGGVEIAGAGQVGYVSLLDPSSEMGFFAHIFNLRTGVFGNLWFPIGPLALGPEVGLGAFTLEVTGSGSVYSLVLLDLNALVNVQFALGPLTAEGLAGYTMHAVWEEGFVPGYYVTVGGRVAIEDFFITGMLDVPLANDEFSASAFISQDTIIAVQIGFRTDL